MTGLKSEIAQERPFSSDEEEGTVECGAHFGLPAAGVSTQNARLGCHFDPIQRAADSARSRLPGADMLGDRRPDDQGRTGHYSAAGAVSRQ